MNREKETALPLPTGEFYIQIGGAEGAKAGKCRRANLTTWFFARVGGSGSP